MSPPGRPKGEDRRAQHDGALFNAPHGACVAVAFSGGPDSLALLHATCRAAAALGINVVALHVHHGLLPEADGWLRWARRLCGRWRRRGWPLRLRWAHLAGAPQAGDSTEAWARRGRYAALAQLAVEEGASLVLLAQHSRDQAETVLLQALRAGGPAGLAAMPRLVQRQGLHWARPWLDQPRSGLAAYLARHRLRPLQDPSNNDTTFARNRLRLQVWPALAAAFGDVDTALAGVARRAHEAAAALAELAALDLAPLVDAQGRLQVAGWRQLSSARQANALRAWWACRAGRGAPESLIQRLLAQVPLKGAARWPAGAGAWCVLQRGVLHWAGAAATDAACWPALPVPLASRPAEDGAIDLSQPGRWHLPDQSGCFEVVACQAGGADPALLRALQARQRAGGERFQLQANGLPRSLKKQYQALGLPAAVRHGPLLWAADRLVFAPGLGLDARCQAPAGMPQLALRWCAAGPALSGGHKPAG